MGKGLSRLQIQILEVLGRFPLAPAETGDLVNISRFARPRDIVRDLGLAPDAATRVAVSKALARLHQRGLVVAYYSSVATQGRGRRYAREASS